MKLGQFIAVLVALAMLFAFAPGVRAEDEQPVEGDALDQAVHSEPGQPPVLVPVPRVTVYPGDVITAEMLWDRDFAREGLPVPTLFTDRAGLIGKISRQTLLPKAPIPPNAVREPYAIKQGQAAVVVFESGGLVILATAMPLEPGSVGETIALRNTDSGTTIRGVVQADGTVRVGTP